MCFTFNLVILMYGCYMELVSLIVLPRYQSQSCFLLLWFWYPYAKYACSFIFFKCSIIIIINNDCYLECSVITKYLRLVIRHSLTLQFYRNCKTIMFWTHYLSIQSIHTLWSLFNYLSIYPFIYLSIYLSIYIYIILYLYIYIIICYYNYSYIYLSVHVLPSFHQLNCLVFFLNSCYQIHG